METEGFLPVVGPNPKVLVLGAFPGRESLRLHQYYGHPRNLFWYMMGRICNAGRDKDYKQRLEILEANGIALWDVVKSCDRSGSMDAQLRDGYFSINDFTTFLSIHTFQALFFDGKKAAELFQRYAAPTLGDVPYLSVLPSTSPANASIPLDVKVARWLEIKNFL